MKTKPRPAGFVERRRSTQTVRGARGKPGRAGERGPRGERGPAGQRGPAGELSAEQMRQLAETHEQLQQAFKELQIQFERIAQMQAQLDAIQQALMPRKPDR